MGTSRNTRHRSTVGRRIAAVAVAVSAAAGVAGLTAGTAHAATVDKDDVKVAVPLGKADFGRGAHLGGAPVSPGEVTWDDHNRTATVRGTVYWDDVTAGGYARVRVVLLDNSGRTLDSAASGAAGRPGGWTGVVPSRGVELRVSSPQARTAKVVTESAPTPTGPWTFVGSQTVRYGDVGGQ